MREGVRHHRGTDRTAEKPEEQEEDLKNSFMRLPEGTGEGKPHLRGQRVVLEKRDGVLPAG